MERLQVRGPEQVLDGTDGAQLVFRHLHQYRPSLVGTLSLEKSVIVILSFEAPSVMGDEAESLRLCLPLLRTALFSTQTGVYVLLYTSNKNFWRECLGSEKESSERDDLHLPHMLIKEGVLINPASKGTWMIFEFPAEPICPALIEAGVSIRVLPPEMYRHQGLRVVEFTEGAMMCDESPAGCSEQNGDVSVRVPDGNGVAVLAAWLKTRDRVKRLFVETETLWEWRKLLHLANSRQEIDGEYYPSEIIVLANADSAFATDFQSCAGDWREPGVTRGACEALLLTFKEWPPEAVELLQVLMPLSCFWASFF